ncbi:MAG: DALR domain-containing protein, partial [archaeon]
VVRFFLLSTHYRSPIDFSDTHLEQAKTGLGKLLNAVETLEFEKKNGKKADLTKEENELIKQIEEYEKKFIAAMDDDFNTSIAIATLFDITKTVNKYLSKGNGNKKIAEYVLTILHNFDKVLNILKLPEKKITEKTQKIVETLAKDLKVEGETFEELIKKIIKKRQTARKDKDFKTSDKIRKMLDTAQIVLEDQPDNTVRWKIKG